MVTTEDYEDYIEATEVARKFGVSIHTIRRRIREKKIFKGAIKLKLPAGERWLIPRSEVGQISMREISPKLYQERYKNKIESAPSNEEPQPLSPSIKSLEERLAIVERHLLKMLG